jgi:hypothetical protein
MSVLERFKRNGRGAEIGVFQGRFSSNIIKTVRPEKLFLIDPWINFDDPGLEKAWYKKGSKHDMNAHYTKVTEKFARRIDSGQIEVLRGTAAEMMPTIEDESLDFVYIDGDHRYEGVKVDLELAYQKVAPGGVIAVDDHVLGNWWADGVVRATNEFLGRYAQDLKILACEEHQVVIQRHPLAKEETPAIAAE